MIGCRVLILFFLGASLFTAQAKNIEKRVVKKPLFIAEWQRIYGGKEDDVAQDIVALEKGDSAIVGTCKSFDAKSSDICVLRMDAHGNVRWRLFIGGKKQEFGKSIARAADGNLFVLGKSKSFSKEYDYDLYLSKVTLEGKLLWSRSIGGTRDEYPGGVVGTDDGGAVIVGSSESFRNGYKDIYIVRLDAKGRVRKQKIFGGERDDAAYNITRLRDGNFVLVGSRETERSGDSDFFAMKIDQKLNKLWFKSFGGDEEDILYGVTPTIDNGVVAVGSTRSYGSSQTDMAVVRLDAKGAMQWIKLYGYKYYEYAYDVALRRDGGFMIAGGTNTLGKGDHSPYFIALDRNGKLQWSHVYGGDDRDIMYGITRMRDGSLIAVGETESFRNAKKFYMIKLRKNRQAK